MKIKMSFLYYCLMFCTIVVLALSTGDAFAEDPVAPAAPTTKKRKVTRSKLTHDESEATADKRRLLLTTGEDKIVDLEFNASRRDDAIVVGNPTVLGVTKMKIGDYVRQLAFKPLKAGETTVTVRDDDGALRLIFTVRVTGSNLLRIAGELRDLLRDIEGIDIRIVGPKVVIEGEVLVPADYGRLLTVIQDKVYDGFVMNLTTLSPLAMQVLAKRIQDDINKFAANVTTRVVNGMIFLEGTVDSQDHAKRAKDVASLYLPDVRPANPLLKQDQLAQQIPDRKLVQSFIIVNPPPAKKEDKLVRITVHFVELSKDYSKLFGFKWQPGITTQAEIGVGTSATGGTTANGASFAGTISSLIPKLQSFQAAGYARILNTGTVVVRNGQVAKLVEQTQVPYTVQGQNGQVTSAREAVGLSLSVTPVVLGQSEDIQLDLILDQTEFVTRAVAGQAPVTAAHKVDTKIYIKSNESAAVAGVTSSNVHTNFNKDPGGTVASDNTDALFTLLRQKTYEKKKSQFVIFVTPQIVQNASEGTEDLKKNFRVKVK